MRCGVLRRLSCTQFDSEVAGNREFNPEAPGDRERTELATEWLRITEELELEALRFGLQPKAEDTFSLSLECLAQAPGEPRGDIDLVLQGWLELCGRKRPTSLFTGLNEEHVAWYFYQAIRFCRTVCAKALGLPCQNTALRVMLSSSRRWRAASWRTWALAAALWAVE